MHTARSLPLRSLRSTELIEAVEQVQLSRRGERNGRLDSGSDRRRGSIGNARRMSARWHRLRDNAEEASAGGQRAVSGLGFAVRQRLSFNGIRHRFAEQSLKKLRKRPDMIHDIGLHCWADSESTHHVTQIECNVIERDRSRMAFGLAAERVGESSKPSVRVARRAIQSLHVARGREFGIGRTVHNRFLHERVASGFVSMVITTPAARILLDALHVIDAQAEVRADGGDVRCPPVRRQLRRRGQTSAQILDEYVGRVLVSAADLPRDDHSRQGVDRNERVCFTDPGRVRGKAPRFLLAHVGPDLIELDPSRYEVTAEPIPEPLGPRPKAKSRRVMVRRLTSVSRETVETEQPSTSALSTASRLSSLRTLDTGALPLSCGRPRLRGARALDGPTVRCFVASLPGATESEAFTYFNVLILRAFARGRPQLMA